MQVLVKNWLVGAEKTEVAHLWAAVNVWLKYQSCLVIVPKFGRTHNQTHTQNYGFGYGSVCELRSGCGCNFGSESESGSGSKFGSG